MFFPSFIVLTCISTISGSSGPLDPHLDETRGSLTDNVAFNSNKKGLSDYLSETQYQDNWSQLTNVPSTPVISSCAAFIDYFGDLSANFTNCVVSFARPLRVCENCVEQYLRAKSAFDLVMKGQHKDEYGVDCGNLILNSDRIQIIVRTYNFIKSIWDDCSCNNCFEFTDTKNDTIHYRLSNETIRFHQLAVETMACFENYSMIQPQNSTGKNASGVCTHCADVYHKINDLYHHMEEDNHNHVCMDVVDTINSTRLEWSQTYKCSVKQVDPTPVFIISGLFCLLPIFFYLGNCIHVRRTNAIQDKPMGQDPPEDTDVNDSS